MPRATLVIDTTEQCNARCRYCQWGDGRTAIRAHAKVDSLCLDADLVGDAAIGRVVLSGGEPLLHPDIDRVLGHYRQLGIGQRVVITNGLAASHERLAGRCDAGATGFAFSIDAAPCDSRHCARAMTPAQHDRIFTNLTSAGRLREQHGLELTVNCVLSAANCSVEMIERLVCAVAERGAVAIKFQPVFDDGYLGHNAPHLRLGAEHWGAIREIGRAARSWPIATNPPRFFEDAADAVAGRTLDGASCGLGGAAYVLQAGGLVICPWIESRPAQRASELSRLRRDFDAAKTRCGTGTHCFCLQPAQQAWRYSDAHA